MTPAALVWTLQSFSETAINLKVESQGRFAVIGCMDATEPLPIGAYMASLTATDDIETAQSIEAKLQSLLDDPDTFEEGEPRPSVAAQVAVAALLKTLGDAGIGLPQCTVGVYFGEIDLTWQSGVRLLRLIVYSDGRLPKVYWQSNSADALARGESASITEPGALLDKARWLIE